MIIKIALHILAIFDFVLDSYEKINSLFAKIKNSKDSDIVTVSLSENEESTYTVRRAV